MYAGVCQMRTEPLQLSPLICLFWIQVRRRSGHMLLSLRCNLRERRREWRGGVISWQKLLSALSPWGETMFHSPPLLWPNEREILKEKSKKKRRERGERGCVRCWHTLLPAPLLLADKLSDTTDYSSHYSQRLTSVCVYVCVCVCVC